MIQSIGAGLGVGTIALKTCSLVSAAPGPEAKPAASLDACNVVWDSPSKDSSGSMPLGNGDVGVNAWVEANGDLVLLVGKTDAWDEKCCLCKIGRLRVKCDPPLAVSQGFKQELKLREGCIEVRSQRSVAAGQKSEIILRLWIDAHYPIIHVEGVGGQPFGVTAQVELWRTPQRKVDPKTRNMWDNCWDRSWIHLADTVEAQTVTCGYVLQRFMSAGSRHGGSPIKFNGSIFTVERKPGASPETDEGDPDNRQWGGCYWFQNTRLIYWSMLAAGDLEMMDPFFKMYRDGLALSKARIQTYYKFAGAAIFPETMYFWGLPNIGDYGWSNSEPEPQNGYIKRHWNGNLELLAIMLDRYDFTQDKDLAKNTLLPPVDPLIAFFGEYWPRRDANGKIIMDGKKLYLFPAWPKDWDVNFKLHASYRTTVEGELCGGKMVALKVTPKSRESDVVNMLKGN